MKTFLAMLAVSIFAVAAVCGVAAGEPEAVVETAQNGIPLIVIRVDEQELHQSKKGNWYGSIADMNASSDHSVRCEGAIEILLPEEGYRSEYGGTAPGGSIQLDYIRGRGNSTWKYHEKKPYKIKLKKAMDLFGMGESKEWALLANATDPSLLKNRVTSWLGSSIGLSYTPQMIPVDVVMIGSESGRKELGSYLLSEQISVEPSRIAIEELGEDVISEEGESNIMGGYLLSVYNPKQDYDDSAGSMFSLGNGVRLMNVYPSFEDENDLTEGERAQREYIKAYVLAIDDLIMNTESFDEETHQKLSALLDLQSAADYWLIQEFSQNSDAFATSSTYLYKSRNGRLCFGPLWDFDLGWGDPKYSGYYEASTTGFNYTEFCWMDELREKDPYFVEIIEQEWFRLKPLLEEAGAEGGVIDRYRNEILASREADFALWNEIESISIKDYDQLTGNLKTWISYRLAWIDNNLDELSDSFVYFTLMMPDGTTIETFPVRKGNNTYYEPDLPVLDGYIFVGWFEKESHTEMEHYEADRDAVFVAEFLEEDLAVLPEALYLKSYEKWIAVGEYYVGNLEAMVWPENVTYDKIRWTSSNSDVVSVEKGWGEAVGVGDAILTGTLHNGVSNSCLIHVYNSNTTKKEDAAGVKAVPGGVLLAPGEMLQVLGIPAPEGRPLKKMMISIESEDPSIAEVISGGSFGEVFLVGGVSEGTATLTITAEDMQGQSFTAHCTVTVTGPGGFMLPASLSTVEEEAFLGTDFSTVIIPASVASIGKRAFAETEGLRSVVVYAESLTIADDAFEGCPNLTVFGYAGTAMDDYCRKKGISFVAIK